MIKEMKGRVAGSGGNVYTLYSVFEIRMCVRACVRGVCVRACVRACVLAFSCCRCSSLITVMSMTSLLSALLLCLRRLRLRDFVPRLCSAVSVAIQIIRALPKTASN